MGWLYTEGVLKTGGGGASNGGVPQPTPKWRSKELTGRAKYRVLGTIRTIIGQVKQQGLGNYMELMAEWKRKLVLETAHQPQGLRIPHYKKKNILGHVGKSDYRVVIDEYKTSKERSANSAKQTCFVPRGLVNGNLLQCGYLEKSG